MILLFLLLFCYRACEKCIDCDVAWSSSASCHLLSFQMSQNSSSSTTPIQSRTGGGDAPEGTVLNRQSKAVWAGRILFVITLSAVAAVLGVASMRILTDAETDLADTQFASIADRALVVAQAIANRKRESVAAFARIISRMHPNADQWPTVIVPGFEEISRDLLKLSSGGDMGFFPFVMTEQIPAFESFAYEYYANSTDPVFPNNTAISSFGKGIYRFDREAGPPDFRARETSGNTSWGSPYEILMPILQYDSVNYPFLFFNTHADETRGKAWDKMISCSRDPAIQNKSVKCGSKTSLLYADDKGDTPFAGIGSPIFPANNRDILTGIVGTLITWTELFENLFSDEVNGIDIVLWAEGRAHTFKVVDGVVESEGRGDLHTDRGRGRSVVITDKDQYTDDSPIYHLILYPNDELYAVYSTNNARIAAAGAVLIIAFTSLLFFLYDFIVRREFNAKQELLQAKRRFMRYVSHEVRTPLNSVCMGLDLVQKEIATSLGHPSTDEMQHLVEGDTQEIVLRNESVPSMDALEWFALTHDVLSNAQSAVDVLNDLLNYDKIETGTLTLELMEIKVWHLVQKCTNEFKLPASNKSLSLKVCFCERGGDCLPSSRCYKHSTDLSDDALQHVVIGDSVRLTQVLRNLVSNALKFTPVNGTVTVRAASVGATSEMKTFALKNGESVTLKQSGKLRLIVKDTGAGMSQDQLAKLFRPGVQFDANSLQGGKGSGFGLYIAKGIVEQHGGTLTASSEGLGEGSTFTMMLPLYHDPDVSLHDRSKVSNGERRVSFDIEAGLGTATQEAKEVEAQQSTASLESMALRILVVDDVASNRKLLCRLLKNAGHTFDDAVNGKEAVDKVQEAIKKGELYDTILLDYEMPVMNGPTAAKEIRALGSDVFIVAITGNMLPEDVAYFRSCGADAVLPKPFKMNELDTLWLEHGLL